MTDRTPAFDTSVAARYDQFLRPLFFEPYAAHLAARLEIGHSRIRVLEVACGTGILTRALLGVVPGDATLVASDASEQMLAIAQEEVSPDERLAFQQADGTDLPFDDAAFDVVACQFGLMFFPDKLLGLREMRRVLAPGGQLLLATWNSLAANPVAKIVDDTVRELSPGAPPVFLQIPYHMHDAGALERMVREAGFRDVAIEVVSKRGSSPSAQDAATGVVLGTPLSHDLADKRLSVQTALDRVTATLIAEFGSGAIDAPLSALVVTARC